MFPICFSFDFPSYLLIFLIKIIFIVIFFTVSSEENAEQCKILVIFTYLQSERFKNYCNRHIFRLIGMTMHLLIYFLMVFSKLDEILRLTSFYEDVRVEGLLIRVHGLQEVMVF